MPRDYSHSRMHPHDLGWQGRSSKALRFSEWVNSSGVYSKDEHDILCLVEIKYRYMYVCTYHILALLGAYRL